MEIIKKFDEFILEKKKMNAGLRAYLDKKAGKKSDKDDKDEKESNDKENDDDKDEKECETKGLTDKQKKLPPALQKAILKRMKK
jgi:hypothetical protein